MFRATEDVMAAYAAITPTLSISADMIESFL